MCDFSRGFNPPEMVKKRPVIVFKRSSRERLVIVVPISTVTPNPIKKYHFQMPNVELPNSAYFKNKQSWLKGDMIYTVGWHRLELVRLGHVNGQRKYHTACVSLATLGEIQKCVLNGIGLGHLEKWA